MRVLLLIVMFLLFVSTGYASEAGEVGQSIYNIVMKILITVITATVGLYVTKFLRYLEKSRKIKLDIDTKQFLLNVAQTAVRNVAELAAIKVKAGEKLTGQEKLDEAIKFVLKQAIKHVPKLTKEEVEVFVNASLTVEEEGAKVSLDNASKALGY